MATLDDFGFEDKFGTLAFTTKRTEYKVTLADNGIIVTHRTLPRITWGLFGGSMTGLPSRGAVFDATLGVAPSR